MARKVQKRERGEKRKPEEEIRKARQELYELTRRVVLAGIGAAALAHDEVSAFVDRLVERGELAQEQARDLLKEVAEKREGRLKEMAEHARERLGPLLEALDVPRHADLEATQKRIDRLTEKVEALLRQTQERG